ncbi:oligopeptide transport system permease protein [Lysobacter sp. yr284]|uniref:ABC transporter permease n=1 Tax=Lysobacter sp. yr284 TaxID=1761791 RepID=UPI00089683D0|nr:ABC transporter permease [Lysobacter sp. yr284]SDZ27285.1 oligopeptide transport system permease protein [Lysobacter sp. yr284]
MRLSTPLPPLARTCLTVLGLLAAACWLGPWLGRYGPVLPDWEALSAAPGTAGHWFGTDAIGRDVFARTLAGGRLSLGIGLLASVVALVIGLGYGAVAGLAGGWVERWMLRVLDVFSALPFLLVVILLLTLFDRSLWLLLAAIGGYVWIDLARVMRAEAARLREAAFVLAAQAAGASFGQRLRWHVLPNLLPLALVYLGLILPQAILVESFLGFLGLSIDEPSSSWGGLLAEGVQELDSAPWTLLFPAGFLVATLAAFQFLGDGLRDWLDVRGQAQTRGDAPAAEAAAA